VLYISGRSTKQSSGNLLQVKSLPTGDPLYCKLPMLCAKEGIPEIVRQKIETVRCVHKRLEVKIGRCPLHALFQEALQIAFATKDGQ
jgi:hypothetical protein